MTQVAGIAMVRDEQDIVGYTVGWMLTQVDHVYVLDNRSKDRTPEILGALGEAFPGRLTVIPDDEVAYYQSRKMSDLAARAEADGYEWVVPFDADEVWYSPVRHGRTIRETLTGLKPHVLLAEALLINHFPTTQDPSPQEEPNPIMRLRWREREPQRLPKVAARTGNGLVIEMGNHGAHYRPTNIPGVRTVHPVPARARRLEIRHYGWRSPEQYVSKIVNGCEAYAETDLDPGFGHHWRQFSSSTEEEIVAHYQAAFVKHDPITDGLIPDPFLEAAHNLWEKPAEVGSD